MGEPQPVDQQGLMRIVSKTLRKDIEQNANQGLHFIELPDSDGANEEQSEPWA